RITRSPAESATHTAPSASRHMPSGAKATAPSASMASVDVGTGPRAPQSRRGPSDPSAAMSNALMRLPIDSLITSVVPSGVIAGPFGNISGSRGVDTRTPGWIGTRDGRHVRVARLAVATLAGAQVDAKVPGVGDPRRCDDHVVDVTTRDGRQ